MRLRDRSTWEILLKNSMLELAEAVLEEVKSKSKLEYCDLPTDDPKQRCPDITKARSILNWEPKVSLQEGLAKTVAYYQDLMKQETS